MKYEIAICAKSTPESWRKNEGNIIAVVPYPHLWGKKEMDRFLIVIVDSAYDYVTIFRKLMQKNISGKKYPFSLPLAQIKKYLPELNVAKVSDESLKYQPFKKRSQLVSIHPSIDIVDVDGGDDPEIEKSIDLDVGDLIKSNISDQYVEVQNIIEIA